MLNDEDQPPNDVQSRSVPPRRGKHARDATIAVVDPPVNRKPHRDRDRGGRLLSTQAAADYTGWPYTSIVDMVHRGLLPVVRIPGSRRMWFDRDDLNRAIDNWKERLD